MTSNTYNPNEAPISPFSFSSSNFLSSSIFILLITSFSGQRGWSFNFAAFYYGIGQTSFTLAMLNSDYLTSSLKWWIN